MNREQALAILKEKGYKYTGKRERMVQLFQEQGRYLTAKEVLDYMQNEYPGLSFDTIYRNLALFTELGIVEETEWRGEKRFNMICEADHHHHHLICTKCGRVRIIAICPMNAILGKPDNFEITGHKFEIYGNCIDCRASA